MVVLYHNYLLRINLQGHLFCLKTATDNLQLLGVLKRCGMWASCARQMGQAPTPDRGIFSQFSFSECLIIIGEQKSKIASRILIFVFCKYWKLKKWIYNFWYLGSAKTEKQWIFNFRLEWKSKIDNQKLRFWFSWFHGNRMDGIYTDPRWFSYLKYQFEHFLPIYEFYSLKMEVCCPGLRARWRYIRS